MSHEAIHNTKVELEKQKKEMSDTDLAISNFEKLRDAEQKKLSSERTKKIDLETKISKNIQDQKKPDADKALLNQQKIQMESDLQEIVANIPIYTSIVADYNNEIQKLKNSKDKIQPKLDSAKKESLGERIGHFTKRNWKSLTAAVVASTILAGGFAYKYGQDSVENEKGKNGNEKPSTEQKTGKDSTDSKKKEDPKKDSVKVIRDTTAHYKDGAGNNNQKPDKPGKTKSPSKEHKNNSPEISYRITNPDGTKEKTFNKKEERDEFIKDHGLILNENPTTVKTGTPKVEWKLTSPDGKQTKTFNTKAERDAFAQAHGLHVNE